MKTKLTQKQQVLTHLKSHNSITSWDAIIEYGITRLSHHIYCLRNDGYIIPDERIKVSVSKTSSTGQTGTFNIYSIVGGEGI